MSRKAQNFVTILTKLHPSIPYDYDKEQDRDSKVSLKRIEELIESNLGNYSHKKTSADKTKSEIELKLDATGLIHFASLHVIAGKEDQGEPHYLFLELTIDGNPEVAINAFVEALASELIEIYSYIDENLNSKLKIINKLIKDQYKIKRSPWPSFFQSNSLNGLPFSGTAGLDLKDMHDDAIISEYAQDTIQDISKEIERNNFERLPFQTNSPDDIFLHVKKSIVENTSNISLSRAWKRSNSRKETPNFAEEMDSNWREEWSQFKLFSSIIPNWARSLGILIYLSVFFILSYIFSSFIDHKIIKKGEIETDESSRLEEILSNEKIIHKWEEIRYTGSPFSKINIDNKCKDVECTMELYPWFLIEGVLIAFSLFFLLRFAPALFKRASAALTLVLGFNLFLWFPNFFDFSRLNKFSSPAIETPSFGGFLFLDFFVLIFVLISIYVLVLFVRWVLNLRFFTPIAKIYNHSHQWLHFILSISVLFGYLYLGINFIESTPKLDFYYKYETHEPIRIDQFVFIPMLLSSILCLNIVAIYFHIPRSIKNFALVFSNLKARLGKFSPTVRDWNAGKFLKLSSLILIYSLSHYSIYTLAFSSNSSMKSEAINLLNAVVLASILGAFSCFISSALTSRNFNNKSFIIFASLFWLAVLNNLAGDNALTLYTNLLISIPVTLMVIIISLIATLGLYLRSEHRNKQRYDNPYTDVTEELFENENKVIQNHMISVQRLIPEHFRRLITLPLMLQAIGGVLGKQRFRPGFLANVGTVHSARWLHLPNTDNYIFVSNYDGSFESYLEDFAKNAVEGTNLAWNNCIGFPKIKGLFKGGVQDSDRFKRYARRSMQPTRFWYSAVSDKSAEQIRRNALIRDGLTQDSLTASQAQAWLDLFTSIPRPEWVIEKDKVQNILFGANSRLTEGGMFTVKNKN